MRSAFVGFTCLLAACRGVASSAIPESRADTLPSAPAARAAVLVELFTSEGCSSCPPADALLADLAADPRVFALSFHVDYWNQLGWADRFSSADNTARQSAYAASFADRGLYTPQLIVGGVAGFVGSDRAQAQSAVARALAQPDLVTLTLQAKVAGADLVQIDYSAPGAPPGSLVNVALVDRNDTTQVTAGENAGRTLRHVDVVRAFVSARAAASGTLRLRASPPLELIAFVQRAPEAGKGMPVLGVARANVTR